MSGIGPDGKADATTGATASHQFSLDQYLTTGKENKFVVCVEVNAPADPNQAWTDAQLGQPSLLYTALVDVDADVRYAILELTAHGGEAIESGTLNYDFEGIGSARQLIDLLLLHTSAK